MKEVSLLIDTHTDLLHTDSAYDGAFYTCRISLMKLWVKIYLQDFFFFCGQFVFGVTCTAVVLDVACINTMLIMHIATDDA